MISEGGPLGHEARGRGEGRRAMMAAAVAEDKFYRVGVVGCRTMKGETCLSCFPSPSIVTKTKATARSDGRVYLSKAR